MQKIESVNHVPAIKCIKTMHTLSKGSAVFRPNVRMGKNCDLSDFHRGMIVGARKGGLSISEPPANKLRH